MVCVKDTATVPSDMLVSRFPAMWNEVREETWRTPSPDSAGRL
jgi:hypothetical protein